MTATVPVGAASVLRRAAGAAAVRPGTARDRTAGVVPAWVVRPRGVDAVAAVLAAADGRGWGVLPCGGGGGMAWGRAPWRCDVLLDLTGLDRVLEHAPGDLVVSAEAGVTLEGLRRHLDPAAGPQRLMLDEPAPVERAPGPTLGGVVAAAASGPRRHRYGTARDLLLGARFVLADGTVARSGGRVVKNVAGYDLCKLLVGSRGTLAVVVEVTLRLHPEPEALATVTLRGVAAPDLVGIASRVRSAPAVVTAFEALWPDREVVLQVEGSRDVAAIEGAALARAVGGRVASPVAAARAWERVRRRPWDGAGSVVGVAVPPGRTGDLARQLESLGCPGRLSVGIGTGAVRVAEEAPALLRLRAAVEALGGWCRPQRVAPALAEAAGTRPEPGALELMGAVRRQLDPRATLSPGRLGWGLP